MARHTPKGAKKSESSEDYEARKHEQKLNANRKAKVNKGGKGQSLWLLQRHKAKLTHSVIRRASLPC